MRNNAFAINATQLNLLLTFLVFSAGRAHKIGRGMSEDRPPPLHLSADSTALAHNKVGPKYGQVERQWAVSFRFSVCSLVTGNVVPCLSQDSPRLDNTLHWYANCLPSLRVTDTGREQQQERERQKEKEREQVRLPFSSSKLDSVASPTIQNGSTLGGKIISSLCLV